MNKLTEELDSIIGKELTPEQQKAIKNKKSISIRVDGVVSSVTGIRTLMGWDNLDTSFDMGDALKCIDNSRSKLDELEFYLKKMK